MKDLWLRLIRFLVEGSLESFQKPNFRFMDDGTPRKLNILPDHFSSPSPTTESSQDNTPSSSQPKDDISLR